MKPNATIAFLALIPSTLLSAETTISVNKVREGISYAKSETFIQQQQEEQKRKDAALAKAKKALQMEGLQTFTVTETDTFKANLEALAKQVGYSTVVYKNLSDYCDWKVIGESVINYEADKKASQDALYHLSMKHSLKPEFYDGNKTVVFTYLGSQFAVRKCNKKG